MTGIRADAARRPFLLLLLAAAVLVSASDAAGQDSEPGSPASPALVGSKDIEAEVIPFPRATSPGSVVRLIYSVMNYEDSDVRVRLRVVVPPGWTLLDTRIEEQEFTIESYDEINGEILATVDRAARPGDRALVRIQAEVVGEPGVYDGQHFVSITRTGGVAPGVVALTGSTTVGVSRVSSGMDDARTAGGLALSGKLDGRTTVTLSAGRDMAENLTNYRYNFEPVKVTGSVRHGSLDVSFGNMLFSGGTAITGPFVRGRGGRLMRQTGRLIGDLTISQPTTYLGEASGHLVRGRVGLNGAFGSISFVASDFSRPAGYTTLLPVVVVLDPDEAERQEIERRLAEGSARNRVAGGGVEAELRGGRTHRATVRVGALHLSNAAGTERTAPAAEAAYGYSGRSATLNVRWRETPPSVQGVQIGGDDAGADGTVRIRGSLRLVAQAFRSVYEVTGVDAASVSSGGAIGTRVTPGRVRLELRGNYRELTYDTKSTRRTGALYAGLPVGIITVSGHAEIGESVKSGNAHPLAFFRADMRVVRETGTASFSVSQIRSGGLPVMQRADVLASIKLREYELSGGAWMTRGYRVGGHPGAWTTVGVPTPFGVTAVVGVEYAPLTYIAEPGWRASFMLRRALVVPIRTMRD
jgi:hypothetical protein